MIFTEPNAELWIPDGTAESVALSRVTHMGIGAHQDNLEIMCLEGILAGFGVSDKWFMGVVVTNGATSPREGIYANYTNEQMVAVRRIEQKKAAFVGDYSAVAFLDHPSSALKSSSNPAAKNDLKALLSATRPEIVYTHNLADKHDTHSASRCARLKRSEIAAGRTAQESLWLRGMARSRLARGRRQSCVQAR